jgi:hypothetical protein
MASTPKPLLFDHILKVQYDNPKPLIAYPRKGTNADFEPFTARELDVMVERAAKYYQKTGLDPVSPHCASTKLETIRGPSS